MLNACARDCTCVVLAVLVGEGLSPVVIQVSVLYRNAWEQTCVRFQIFFFWIWEYLHLGDGTQI
jgi:hypothetical protein